MKKLLVILCIILVIMIGGILCASLNGEQVSEAEKASVLAQQYITNYYGDKYSHLVIGSVSTEEDMWVVEFIDKSEEAEYRAGGGSPIVYINKNNDKMIWCLFSK